MENKLSDFDMTAAVKHNEAIRRVVCPISLLMAATLISTMLHDPADQKSIIIPTKSPISPTRLVKNAFRAASEFGFSSHQWPINAKEHTSRVPNQRLFEGYFSLRTKAWMLKISLGRQNSGYIFGLLIRSPLNKYVRAEKLLSPRTASLLLDRRP